MKYPNRLGEFMRAAKLDDPTLAQMAGTTKQNIWKLRKGGARLSSSWASRLAPHIGVPWPVLMDPESPEAQQFEPERLEMLDILEQIGARLAWVRGYRDFSEDGAARRLGMTTERLRYIERGMAEMTLVEVISVAKKLRVPLDFLLLGEVAHLSPGMADSYGRNEVPSSAPVPPPRRAAPRDGKGKNR